MIINILYLIFYLLKKPTLCIKIGKGKNNHFINTKN